MLTDALKLILETEEPPDWSQVGSVSSVRMDRAGSCTNRQSEHPASPFAGRASGVVDHRFGLIQASISEVVDELDLALPDVDAPFVSKSAVAQARQR